MPAISDLRTVHSRAYTAYKELKKTKDDVEAGLPAFIAKWRAWEARTSWHRPNSDAEITARFPTWDADKEKMMNDLKAVVLMLDDYALPAKKWKG